MLNKVINISRRPPWPPFWIFLTCL